MSSLTVEGCIDFLRLQGIKVVDSSPSNGARSLCDGLSGAYSIGLHAGACCVILFASLAGCVVPIITKYVKCLRTHPFIFIVGKTAATGVLLSVANVHLLYEATAAFNEPCILPFFKEYSPFAFLFALIAVLLMQALDLKLADIAEGWLRAKEKRAGLADAAHDEQKHDGECQAVEPCLHDTKCDEPSSEVRTDERCDGGGANACVETEGVEVAKSEHAGCGGHSHEHHCAEGHGHQHISVLPPEEMGHIRRVIAAACMEFGVALHSIFVGIAVGLTTDDELKPLLVALILHQSFEGMAMGSRLVDASFDRKLEIALVLVFILSAPIGMAAAIVAVSVSPDAMSGGGFVTMMAILDALCGGILLYLAFTLLLGDFVSDLKAFSPPGVKGSLRRKITMFIAVWAGMLIMAAIGKWL